MKMHPWTFLVEPISNTPLIKGNKYAIKSFSLKQL